MGRATPSHLLNSCAQHHIAAYNIWTLAGSGAPGFVDNADPRLGALNKPWGAVADKGGEH
jgi:hypothetical protein